MLKLLKSYFKIFINETILISIMYRYYLSNYLINAIMIAADFIWWMLLIDGGKIIPEKMPPLILGYIIWAYANYITYDSSDFIAEASQTGVLEQIYISSQSLTLQLICRFLADTIFCSLENILIIGSLIIIFGISIPFNLASILIFLITIIGIFGFALAIAGFGLIFKRVKAFTYMINNILLFSNGSILPLESMPHTLQIICKTLPTTQGIIALKAISTNNLTTIQTLFSQNMLLLIINSSIYIILGASTLKICELHAKNQGIIGHY